MLLYPATPVATRARSCSSGLRRPSRRPTCKRPRRPMGGACRRLGLESLVSKRLGSRYLSSRQSGRPTNEPTRPLGRFDLLRCSTGIPSTLLVASLGTHFRSASPALNATNAIGAERFQPDGIVAIPTSAILRLELRQSIDVPPVSCHRSSRSRTSSSSGWRWDTRHMDVLTNCGNRGCHACRP
jgi:hypothetical protein